MELKKGLFVSFEGGEGAGKSTQIQILAQALEQQGLRVFCTREPGGTKLGDRIRELLIDKSLEAMSPKCEALLYAAARAEHVNKTIAPALQKSQLVLCDRFLDASRAYQGVARGLGRQAVDDVNLWATDGVLPDRVYVFKLPPEEGLRRVSKRQGGELDRLESESIDFHEKILKAYLGQARRQPERYKVIDASQSLEKLSQDLLEDMKEWIKTYLV